MKRLIVPLTVIAGVTGTLWHYHLPPFSNTADKLSASPVDKAAISAHTPGDQALPLVSVARAKLSTMKDSILIVGTLVPRLEVLVAPEIEGLRVIELLADEGDRVAKGQTLARLETETLKVQLAQNDAGLAKATAAIAQARSSIVSAEAKQVEASNAFDRARPLKQSGVVSDSTLDQRESAARSAVAALAMARDSLLVSEAEKAQVEAQRRDLVWRLGKTDINAPVAGVVSRRSTRIGGMASGSAVAEPMFRLIADGQIELEAEVPETLMARLSPGQAARITIAGVGDVEGRVRLIAPEVDKATRQGRVRISLGDNPQLRMGSFGRGRVMVHSSEALTVPSSAVLFGADGATVQVVSEGLVQARKIVTGLQSGDLIEIRSGLTAGEIVVAKAGSFLRAGDRVKPQIVADAPAKLN